MPLPKRVIEPVHVSRGTIPDDFPLPSELEAATNGTLANAVRQLSSLSKHAEDMFGELARDAQQLHERSNSLQARIDRLAMKVTQLDSTVEEVSLQDIHMRKAFKSSVVFDQQIFSRATMPTAMLETYQTCDKPPPLDKLNCYRDDGKDGLKFYTDPNYFFELWRQEMLIDTERMMHDKGKKPHRPRTSDGGQGNRHKKRPRQPLNTRERQMQLAMGHGEHIMPQNNIYRTPSQLQQHDMSMTDNEMMVDHNRPPRPNSIEIRRSYQQEVPDGLPSPTYPRYDDNPYQQGMYGQGPLSSESLYQGGTPTRMNKIRPTQPPPAPPSNSSTPTANTPTRGRSMSSGRDNLPPPPPPPEAMSPPPSNGLPPHMQSRVNSHQGTPTEPMMQVHDLPPPPPIPKQTSPPKENIPPPPPPPPMPSMVSNGNVPNNVVPNIMPSSNPSPAAMMNGELARILAQSPPKLTPVKDRPIKQMPVMADPRNDLLKAIRDGIKLNRVEKSEQKEVERRNGLHDVASILARRVAVEFSDSESGSDSEDSEGWGDNETSA